MTSDPRHVSPMFHIDVSADASSNKPESAADKDDVVIMLLRQLVAGQEQQTRMMEELVKQSSAAQRQRATELGQWKEANPRLARRCRIAAETLGRVQNEFLHTLTEEVADSEEALLDGEFMLAEFVDRFGPRMAHLNGVLQVLSQLSTTQDPAESAQK
jgi:hypothetical protein